MNNAHTGSFASNGFSSKGKAGEPLPPLPALNQSIIQLANIEDSPYDLSYPSPSSSFLDWGNSQGFHGFVYPLNYTIKRIFGMQHYYKNETGSPKSMVLRFRSLIADGSIIVPIAPPIGTLLGDITVPLPVTAPNTPKFYPAFDSGAIAWAVPANYLFYGYVQSWTGNFRTGLSCSILIEWGT